ncbi:MAG: hypothetical protein QM660_09990 [Dysgonomonas sp.]
MLNNILSIVKEVAQNAVANNTDIPGDKKNEVVETTAGAITTGLTSNLSNLSDLFSSSGGGNIVDTIQKTVVTTLSEKLGLDASIANGIATSVVPAVVSALSGKINDSKEEGFNLESIVGALSGSKDKEGGILSSLVSMFKK